MATATVLVMLVPRVRSLPPDVYFPLFTPPSAGEPDCIGLNKPVVTGRPIVGSDDGSGAAVAYRPDPTSAWRTEARKNALVSIRGSGPGAFNKGARFCADRTGDRPFSADSVGEFDSCQASSPPRVIVIAKPTATFDGVGGRSQRRTGPASCRCCC